MAVLALAKISYKTVKWVESETSLTPTHLLRLQNMDLDLYSRSTAFPNVYYGMY
jgi:hypothetical protein